MVIFRITEYKNLNKTYLKNSNSEEVHKNNLPVTLNIGDKI